jgi:hypothetical protein
MRLLTENNEHEELSTLGDAKGDYISLMNHRLVRIDRSGSLEGLACDSVHGTGRDGWFLPSVPVVPSECASIAPSEYASIAPSTRTSTVT